LHVLYSLPAETGRRNAIVIIVVVIVKFIPIEETIIVKKYTYKVTKVLVLKNRILKEFITNYNKLFTFKY
ncbi:hypothetical protein COCHEDRAFT_1091734, partial [Bipolaris maydis C5]